MSKLIRRLVDIVLKRKKNRLHSEYKKITRSTTNKGKKFAATSSATLELNAAINEELKKRDFCIKNIVIKYLDNPSGILDFIKDHGTPVYTLKNADILLDVIKEEAGFLPPKKGLKALYLNILLFVFARKPVCLALNTSEMFILQDVPENIYSILHQFHKWMSFKMGLPGCDDETQTLLKDMFENKSSPVSVEEIASLKEAIARDREAIDFVLNFAKEYSGAKNAASKLKDDGSATV